MPCDFLPCDPKQIWAAKSRALETVKGAVDLGKKILLPLEFSMRKNDSLVYEDEQKPYPNSFAYSGAWH